MAEWKGTRCAVCVGCGKCFEAPDEPRKGWSGKRCEVCVSCGECAKAWGLVPGDGDDADAVSGATNWADAFKMMDAGSAGDAPPVVAPPGTPAEEGVDPAPVTGNGASQHWEGAKEDAPWAACVGDAEADATTGATPGVATACKELGLDDMASLGESLGIKPPGVA